MRDGNEENRREPFTLSLASGRSRCTLRILVEKLTKTTKSAYISIRLFFFQFYSIFRGFFTIKIRHDKLVVKKVGNRTLDSSKLAILEI